MISVIMPLYNNERYVAEAIKSVMDQSYKNWELIIINDASTDNSYQIADAFSKTDDRISVINLKKNRGVSYARNLGITKSKGEYISFLDSDDLWNKDFLKILLNKLINTKKNFIYARFASFNDSIKIMKPNNTTLIKGNLDNFIIKNKHRYELLFAFHICGILIKKSLIFKYNIFFPVDQTLFEDGLFLSKLLCVTDIIYEQRILMYYRQHAASTVHQKYSTKHFLQELTFLNRLLLFADKYNKNVISSLKMLILYRTYRVVYFILKSDNISNVIININKYEYILNNFCHNNYFKFNDRLKCKLILSKNKIVLNLLKYL